MALDFQLVLEWEKEPHFITAESTSSILRHWLTVTLNN